MLLHDQMSLTAGVQAAQPTLKELMQRRFADSNRRVGQDSIKADAFWDLGGRRHGYPVGGSDFSGIDLGEGPSAAVGVYGPYSPAAGSQSRDAGYRAPTAADVERHRVVVDRRCVCQQQFGARVEAVVREHPAVRGEGYSQVRQVDLCLRRLRGHRRFLIEIVSALHSLDRSARWCDSVR